MSPASLFRDNSSNSHDSARADTLRQRGLVVGGLKDLGGAEMRTRETKKLLGQPQLGTPGMGQKTRGNGDSRRGRATHKYGTETVTRKGSRQGLAHQDQLERPKRQAATSYPGTVFLALKGRFQAGLASNPSHPGPSSPSLRILTDMAGTAIQRQ